MIILAAFLTRIVFNFMKRGIPFLIFSFILSTGWCQSIKTPSATKHMQAHFGIAIHGGAGNLVKLKLTPAQEKEYTLKLTEALQTGYAILEKGGSSIDAVEAAVKILEDSPLFNAGKGSVFTNDGKNEMDAAIMDGGTLKAGAVAEVRTIKNPISAARKVMENSDFVFLSSRGAEAFAKKEGLEIVDTSYFFEQYRWDQMIRVRDSSKGNKDTANTGSTHPFERPEDKFGTVGAVALDKSGHLSAATSTGGIVNKKYNRIGDSPLIGCGTYANDRTCAVSCTGHGEDFIRLVAAKDVSDMMEYKGWSLSRAMLEVIKVKLPKINGRGGAIAIDRSGNISMPFTTSGMYRGYMSNGKCVVMIYEDPPVPIKPAGHK